MPIPAKAYVYPTAGADPMPVRVPHLGPTRRLQPRDLLRWVRGIPQRLDTRLVDPRFKLAPGRPLTPRYLGPIRILSPVGMKLFWRGSQALPLKGQRYPLSR